MLNNQNFKINFYEYLEEIKRFLPEGEMSEMELEVSKQMYQQGKEPKTIARELISQGCCRF